MNQTGDASISISVNNMEGTGSSGDAEMARSLLISFVLACELEYDLLPGNDVGNLPAAKHMEKDREVIEIKRMPVSSL